MKLDNVPVVPTQPFPTYSLARTNAVNPNIPLKTPWKNLAAAYPPNDFEKVPKMVDTFG